MREVYFDDFKVEHIESPVIQSQDFYPFGLAFNSYSRENSLANQYKFQGQEHQDELDLGWDSFKWRNHQPDIGRFFNVDPLSEKYVYNSPYAFSENHVVAHRELEGLEKVLVTGAEFNTHQEGKVYNTGNQIETDKRVYNKDFGSSPDGGDYKKLEAGADASNGKISDVKLHEAGDGMNEETFDAIFHGDPDYFDHGIDGKDTKEGSTITGNVEGANFSIDIKINGSMMTFTSTLTGGDTDKGYSIKVQGGNSSLDFAVGKLQSGRNRDDKSASVITLPFTMDKNGNAVFDFTKLQELMKKDDNESTKVKK